MNVASLLNDIFNRISNWSLVYTVRLSAEFYLSVMARPLYFRLNYEVRLLFFPLTVYFSIYSDDKIRAGHPYPAVNSNVRPLYGPELLSSPHHIIK